MSTHTEDQSGTPAPSGEPRPERHGPRPAPAAPAPAPAAPAPAAAAPPAGGTARAGGSRRRIVLPIVILLGVAALAFGVRQWLYGRHHIATDNAQVEGHIVPVLPKVSGYVTQVLAIENQKVKAGDILVTLDDRDYRAKLAQQLADVTAAEAAPGQAQAQLAAARAAVAQAEANAKRTASDQERYRTLAQRNIVSRQQLDAAEAAADAAHAALQAAQDQVRAASGALEAASARAVSSRAQRDQSALQVSYTRIPAPSDGVVSRKNVEVGQLVQVGQPLMAVVPLEDVWVVANFRETEIRDVVPGDRAEIEVDSYPGRHFRGKVESVSPATGAKFSLLPPDNATGNFTKVVQRIPVRIRLDGAQDPNHPLRPGMSVKATVTTR